jgi:hypothetical protein
VPWVAAIDESLCGLGLYYPTVPPELLAALEEAQRTLEAG